MNINKQLQTDARTPEAIIQDKEDDEVNDNVDEDNEEDHLSDDDGERSSAAESGAIRGALRSSLNSARNAKHVMSNVPKMRMPLPTVTLKGSAKMQVPHPLSIHKNVSKMKIPTPGVTPTPRLPIHHIPSPAISKSKMQTKMLSKPSTSSVTDIAGKLKGTTDAKVVTKNVNRLSSANELYGYAQTVHGEVTAVKQTPLQLQTQAKVSNGPTHVAQDPSSPHHPSWHVGSTEHGAGPNRIHESDSGNNKEAVNEADDKKRKDKNISGTGNKYKESSKQKSTEVGASTRSSSMPVHTEHSVPAMAIEATSTPAAHTSTERGILDTLAHNPHFMRFINMGRVAFGVAQTFIRGSIQGALNFSAQETTLLTLLQSSALAAAPMQHDASINLIDRQTTANTTEQPTATSASIAAASYPSHLSMQSLTAVHAAAGVVGGAVNALAYLFIEFTLHHYRAYQWHRLLIPKMFTPFLTVTAPVAQGAFPHYLPGTLMSYVYSNTFLFGSYAVFRTTLLAASKNVTTVNDIETAEADVHRAVPIMLQEEGSKHESSTSQNDSHMRTDINAAGGSKNVVSHGASADVNAVPPVVPATTASTDNSNSKLPIIQVLAIVGAGICSGVVSEVVGHYASALTTSPTPATATSGGGGNVTASATSPAHDVISGASKSSQQTPGARAVHAGNEGMNSAKGAPSAHNQTMGSRSQITHDSLWNRHKAAFKLPRPTLRTIGPSAIASAIGFIALEFA